MNTIKDEQELEKLNHNMYGSIQADVFHIEFYSFFFFLLSYLLFDAVVRSSEKQYSNAFYLEIITSRR